MRTQGILFQGLYFSTKAEGSFLKEEFSYCKELQTETGHYIDVTYFLLYALCKNPRIRKMLETMEKDWKEYILSAAEKSIYQRGAFWEYLDKGERENAQILLGLLEEIRNCHTSRAEKSWIAFAYLFHKSIGVEYSFLEGEKLVSFEKICSVAEKYQEIPFLPSAYICAAFFWAESQNIEIQRNGTYDFLYPCLKEGRKIWEREKSL